MCKSLDESYLAVVSGKNLVMKQQKVNQLFVFKKDPKGDFNLHKRVVLKDYAEFEKVCMQFFFREGDLPAGMEPHQIVFVKATKILQVNFNEEGDKVLETLRTFKKPLARQPEFFQPDVTNFKVVIASPEDAMYFNGHTDEEFDLDEFFSIGSIKEIKYDEEEDDFYILANKFEEKLGFFIIRINA